MSKHEDYITVCVAGKPVARMTMTDHSRLMQYCHISPHEIVEGLVRSLSSKKDIHKAIDEAFKFCKASNPKKAPEDVMGKMVLDKYVPKHFELGDSIMDFEAAFPEEVEAIEQRKKNNDYEQELA
jgi:hypothetical protein